MHTCQYPTSGSIRSKGAAILGLYITSLVLGGCKNKGLTSLRVFMEEGKFIAQMTQAVASMLISSAVPKAATEPG